jgi:hypothetical protein
LGFVTLNTFILPCFLISGFTIKQLHFIYFLCVCSSICIYSIFNGNPLRLIRDEIQISICLFSSLNTLRIFVFIDTYIANLFGSVWKSRHIHWQGYFLLNFLGWKYQGLGQWLKDVEILPSKCKYLSSNPSTTKKNKNRKRKHHGSAGCPMIIPYSVVSFLNCSPNY